MELYNRRLLLLNEDKPFSSDAYSPPLSSSLLVRPLNPPAPVPFNSDVAYIVVILLFLIGFISVCIRRFADDSPSSRPSASCSSLDQTTVQSLPVFAYDGAAKHQEDCAICLSEFEEDEPVKMIPSCKHVFHPKCIDTWLFSHVTCPICRGTRFFTVERHARLGKVEPSSDQIVRSHQGGLTAENGETRGEGRVAGTRNQRRSSSCSSFKDTVVLRRTLSY